MGYNYILRGGRFALVHFKSIYNFKTYRVCIYVMGLPRPMLVCAVLLGLFTPTPAPPTPDDQQPVTLQELATFLESLQNQENELGLINTSSNLRSRLRKLAEAQEALGQDMGETIDTDKRASYMSLCHFKICNMGKKRDYVEHLRKRQYEHRT